ncbi:MAG: anthranilate synthase component I family protein [Candidatus Marinimicrobia bacterium]|nr:anthranilate synthase component I family protein [Candidatus Neomarinimicrobiota bacterium]MCF7850607.1 anthranilate synthase component I family protein [Candidatus Neomarinimicrobiota bacterium]MCF7903659.1 anthranilate synthase component I family protein [Candidatus Neomarinimicrobiota bacterium]
MIPSDSQIKNVFFTDGPENPEWRHLLAFNPASTFVLNGLNELENLKKFYETHKGLLIAGYFAYDLGLRLLGVESRHTFSNPLAVLHAYDTWEEGHQEKPVPQSTFPPLSFQASLTQEEYSTSIDRIHAYIRAGDFYQINFTQQLRARTTQQPRELFAHLSQRHPASHMCYFEWEDLTIHSLSPELFLHFAGGTLTTEPIKGTRPRGNSDEDDERQMTALLESEKEQAELFMITDLLRNDLGKVCEIGTVELELVKGIQKLPRVWHTYSRIKGKLGNEYTPLDALFSMLPGGSISGCPKKRALEVIDDLESESRGIYTGCLGYFHPAGDFSFNIAIRTLIQQGENLSLGTGGGITIDSNWEDEWNELLTKASTFY